MTSSLDSSKVRFCKNRILSWFHNGHTEIVRTAAIIEEPNICLACNQVLKLVHHIDQSALGFEETNTVLHIKLDLLALAGLSETLLHVLLLDGLGHRRDSENPEHVTAGETNPGLLRNSFDRLEGDFHNDGVDIREAILGGAIKWLHLRMFRVGNLVQPFSRFAGVLLIKREFVVAEVDVVGEFWAHKPRGDVEAEYGVVDGGRFGWVFEEELDIGR